ncbi:MAG TPA: hypothetical protein VLD58_07225 [Gemmatimonadales bacterium]|nr:hypothetical protein [Gemmatimonadales bacterium]
MPARQFDIDGSTWEVAPTGRVTQYTRDEFGVIFRRQDGAEVRVARYAPLGSRQAEDSLAQLSDRELRELWTRSQPAWTAPETGYGR